MTEIKVGRRAGGKMVHLDPETMERVETYREAFESEHPGIRVSTANALASLIHAGLQSDRVISDMAKIRGDA